MFNRVKAIKDVETQATNPEPLELDMSSLKPGDIIHFRCGSSCEVERISPTPHYDYGFEIKLLGYGGIIVYSKNGMLNAEAIGPFDIVRIEKAPVDWSNLKHRDRFAWGHTFVFYIGLSVKYPDCVVCENIDGEIITIHKSDLTAAP